MGEAWLQNMIGFKPWITDELVADIPNPAVELGIHVTTRTVQIGSLLGGAIIGPLLKSKRGGIRGAAIGLVAGPILTYGRIRGAKIDENGLYDRCYRLRNNYWQLIFDRFTYLGALVGGSVYGLRGIPYGINIAVASVFMLKSAVAYMDPKDPLVDDAVQAEASESPLLLPNFNVKDGLKAPKEAYNSYKGDSNAASATPGKCTCGCHYDW